MVSKHSDRIHLHAGRKTFMCRRSESEIAHLLRFLQYRKMSINKKHTAKIGSGISLKIPHLISLETHKTLHLVSCYLIYLVSINS